MILCTKCKVWRSEDSFVRDRHKANGRYAWCKPCTQEIAEQRRHRTDVEAPTEQRCNRCLVVKPLTEDHFGRCRTNFHGFQYECKPCKRERTRAARQSGAWDEASRWWTMKANGPMDKITYRAIFDRDNGICGVCRQPVDPSLGDRQPESGSIDHIIPVSRGGTHTFDNVQLTHLRCNYEKGARPAA